MCGKICSKDWWQNKKPEEVMWLSSLSHSLSLRGNGERREGKEEEECVPGSSKPGISSF
jgi:hypothetical protein